MEKQKKKGERDGADISKMREIFLRIYNSAKKKKKRRRLFSKQEKKCKQDMVSFQVNTQNHDAQQKYDGPKKNPETQ